MTWAKAEKNCQSMGGNLASIHNILEYHEIQRLVMSSSYEYKEAWIGGSDAQEENTWFWSDGKPFHYSNWCSGEKCWDDFYCNANKPSICVKTV
ncbi:hypothetical protein L3Q82_016580 [Scortum barcoo]|uniref:Uncharacterized protein n=1 Tax=Scortum barcoo TaxID=214431 RepID=A0ACB8X7T0_9TELE|nr:hypothetical protein L3Q82_016580 [Scortum barcoo]